MTNRIERDTCEDCEREFIRAVDWQNIDDFLEGTNIWDLKDRNMCVKCFVRICNRYL